MSDNSTPPVTGILELDDRGRGFLRKPTANYRMSAGDPVMPADLIRRYRLRGGEVVVGEANSQRDRSGPPVPLLATIATIDGLAPDDRAERKPFEDLTAIDPRKQIRFATPGGPLPMRVIDLMTPIGFGQRGLIVAPPRTGKTVLLHQMSAGITANHPDSYMMVLLIDERPEEVTEMRRTVHGEVIASSNDENVASHVRLARLVTERAKRLVETGQHVIMLLDSLTRVGRAFNAAVRTSGRIMSGGLDIRALTEPKAIFGAARNTEEAGSLTIIASALIETGSRMDEVIFNEFKGTGNMEIMLSRNMANLRILPAIDLNGSGTRKEELLLDAATLAVSHKIRRQLLDKGEERAMETLTASLGKTKDNEEFVKTFEERRFG